MLDNYTNKLFNVRKLRSLRVASLAEMGLSSNLGISERAAHDGKQPVVAIHYANHDLFSRFERMGSVRLIDDETNLSGIEGDFQFDKPLGSTRPFNDLSRNLHPTFAQAYCPYELRVSADDVVIATAAEDSIIDDRNDLAPLVESYQRKEDRGYVYLFAGKEAIRSFIGSSLDVLDIGDDRQLELEDRGFCMTGDDVIACRFIQLAEISGIDIKRIIPAGHLDRALQETVTTTLIDNYLFLCDEELIGNVSGDWHVAARRFARAYGIEAGEIADVAMIFKDMIKQAAQTRRSDPDSLPDLDSATAARMAQYLVEGIA